MKGSVEGQSHIQTVLRALRLASPRLLDLAALYLCMQSSLYTNRVTVNGCQQYHMGKVVGLSHFQIALYTPWAGLATWHRSGCPVLLHAAQHTSESLGTLAKVVAELRFRVNSWLDCSACLSPSLATSHRSAFTSACTGGTVITVASVFVVATVTTVTTVIYGT